MARRRIAHDAVRVLTRSGLLLRSLLAVALLLALLTGIPWGLWQYVGWPLPDHVPDWDEIEVALTAPLSDTLLLHILACALWPLWALFALDVLRCAADALRQFPHALPRPAGPIHTFAAALIGAVVLSFLGQRSAAPAAEAWRIPPLRPIAAAPVTPHVEPMARTDVDPTPPEPGTTVVRPPKDGIHDSLWRIADRELGDGARWPELYVLNRHRPQPDGRTLTNPDVIHPGWILRLTDHATPAPPERPEPPRPKPPSPHPPPPQPAPSQHQPSPHPPDNKPPPDDGITLPTGGYIGIGLAAAVTALLLAWRIQRHIRYRPAATARHARPSPTPTLSPVIRSLRTAHQQHTAPEPEQSPPSELTPAPGTLLALAKERDRAAGQADDYAATIGTHHGVPVALDVARTRGLGLTGPGATAAARALLLAFLAHQQLSTPSSTHVIVPATDAAELLGEAAAPDALPPGIRLTPSLEAALDAMETELLSRTRQITEKAETDDDRPVPPHILVATPSEHTERRLQAILDNGSTLGLAGVLLGPWPAGGTLRIRPDGIAGATSPHLREQLAGARLFTLPAPDAADLAAFLTSVAGAPATQPEPVPDVPPLEQPEEREWNEAAGEEQAEADVPVLQEDVAVPQEGIPAPEESESRPRIRLCLLGRIRLHYDHGRNHRDITTAVAARKQRAVLVYLALHPDGVRRDLLSDALWPQPSSSRPHNRLNATLSQLRRALRQATDDTATNAVTRRDAYCSLDAELISVDLWELHQALRAYAAQPEEPQHARTLEHAIEELYHGEIAEELDDEWLYAPREGLRHEVLTAVSSLAHRALEHDPQHALHLLNRARRLDRHNEALYCEIARIHARLGQHDAVVRTHSLLLSALAELDAEPSSETEQLFTRLRRSATTADQNDSGPA
ncbi:hypothetical protein [Streptomyces boninensis]|uniref:hypothetical protein n=1 Tax=Streptomyces boninensis TaxID=2039455 RepID=UPI003B20F686